MSMDKEAAQTAMLCFADYLMEWADYYDKLGYFEVGDGITHIIKHMTKEASELRPTQQQGHIKEATNTDGS